MSILRISALCVMGCLVLGSSGYAALQDVHEKKSVVEEQERQKRRLERLRQTMTSLAKRMDEKGRTRAAELLRQGIARVEETQMEQAMAEMVRNIDEGRALQGLEKGEKLVHELEELLDILLDRKDFQKLEQELKDFTELSKAIDELRKQESEIIKQTEELHNKAASPAEKEIQERLQELSRKQQELLNKTEQSNGSELATLQEIQQSLSDLLRRQQKAMEKMKQLEKAKSSSSPNSESQTREARENASQITKASLNAQQSVQKAEEQKAAAEAGKIDPETMKKELEALAKALEEQAKSIEKAETPESKAAAEAMKSIASGIRDSKEAQSQEAKNEQQQAIDSLKQASKEAEKKAAEAQGAEKAKTDLAREEHEIRKMAEKLARTLDSSKNIENNKESSDSLWKAAEKLSQSSEQISDGKNQEASQSAQQAEQKMQEAQQALQKSLKQAEEAVKPRLKAIAEEQKKLEEEAKKLQEEIAERLRREELKPPQAEKASEGTQGAEKSMSKAGSQLDSGNSSQATKDQKEALEQLQKAQQGLSEERKLSEEQKKEAMKLAEKQREVEKQILQLAEQMKKSQNRKPPQGLNSAQEKAKQAAEELDRGDPGEAQPKEEEVEKYLNQSKDEIEKERKKYLQLRHEELLFRIADELKAMIKAHEEAMQATAEADTEKGQSGESPSRALRLKIRKIGKDEESVAADCARIAEALLKEESTVYSSLLNSNEEDLKRVAELMGPDGNYRSDELVKALQQDVAERFGWLLKALQDQIQDNKSKKPDDKGGQSDQGTNQGTTKNRLVPDVAELKMLKQLEDDLARRTQKLAEFQKKGIIDDSMVRHELDRLALRHNKVTELFKGLKSRLRIE